MAKTNFLGDWSSVDCTCDIIDKKRSVAEYVRTMFARTNQMFEYTELPELIFRVGSAAGVVPQEYIAELGLGNLSSDDLLSFTSAVSDFYDKLCEYYDMPDVARHIGYVFDIIEGNTTDGDRLWAVLAESLEGSHGAIINIGESSISDWFTPDRLGELSDYLKNLIDAA